MLTPLPAAKWNYSTAAHLLNRAGFGGPPEEIERLAGLGLERAVDWFVVYEKQPDPFPNPEWAKPDPSRLERFRAFRQATDEQRREMRREQQKIERQRLFELRGWWLKRMARGSRPLEEKLTLFWHGHFATSVEKVKDAYLMWRQNETLRRNAAGSWHDLLTAVSRDPAMLIWLDQAESRKEHPNENFARELMELFTLGEGNYSERDVTEAARAMTGWSVNRIAQEYQFRPFLHDDGAKSFFGRSGPLTGSDILESIITRRQSALFITGKLWRFFASEDLEAPLHEALADSFRKTGQQFRPWLRTIFSSEEFYREAVVRTQIKSPVQWLVGSVKILERDLPPPFVSANALRALGQDLFAPPNVKGWDGGVSWITTNTLLNRYNFAAGLVLGPEASSAIPDRPRMRAIQRRPQRGARGHAGPVQASNLVSRDQRRDRTAFIRALERRLIQGPLKPENSAPIAKYLEGQGELTDTVVLQTARLLMSTPEYQLT